MQNDNPFHATFTLRQHTPMIHFQADQLGALLRASELKPAFDQYLWRNVFKLGVQQEQRRAVFERNKTYMTGYKPGQDERLWKEFEQENWALDYRVKFDYNPADVKTSVITPRFPCFFGDMGDQQSSASRQFKQIKKDFTATFVCLHPELKKIISKQFPDFLRTKNFGLRQSKGFGCFTVHSKAEHFLPRKEHNAYLFRVNETRTDEDLFKHIELFWRVLRTGYNRPGKQGNTVIYVKCPLFFYLRDQWHLDIAEGNVLEDFKTRMSGKSVQWDKRSIKQTYFSTDLIRQQQDPKHPEPDILRGYPTQSDNGRYFLFRDLLGLASESQWMSYRATIKKSHVPSNRDQETINRFKSPVTFKPVRNGNGYDVYVCVKSIPAEYGSQAFLIQRGNEVRLTLETPPLGAFRITKYFDYVRRDMADLIVKADKQVVTLNNDKDPDWIKIKAVFESFRKL